MGTTRAPRVVFDALVENCVEWPETLVFGEGAKDHTRGRVWFPWMLGIRHIGFDGTPGCVEIGINGDRLIN